VDGGKHAGGDESGKGEGEDDGHVPVTTPDAEFVFPRRARAMLAL
jgi:hypothetical protein